MIIMLKNGNQNMVLDKMNTTVKCLILVLILCTVVYYVQGWIHMSIITRGVTEFNAAVQANPTLLNNRTIFNVKLTRATEASGDGVYLENLTIRNLTLRNVDMRRAHLKNVTFVDCDFINTDFDNSKFENVKFIRGKMAGYNEPDIYVPYQTSFRGIDIDRILFDGVYFDKSVRTSFRNGIVVMRNVTTTKKPGHSSLLSGSNLHVRMDNCTVYNQYALRVGGDNSSAYVTNSKFYNTKSYYHTTRASWDPSLKISGSAAWVENCVLAGMMPNSTTVVVTNSQFGPSVFGINEKGTRIFLVNNTFHGSQGEGTLWVFGGEAHKSSTSHAYIYAGTKIPGKIYLGTGNIHIYDATIDEIRMGQAGAKTNLRNLNLQNVIIKEADWEDCAVEHAQWENVHLYPPINLKNANFDTIIGHKIEFPGGTPWINGPIHIIYSDEPLTFDKPPVPTLEEMGLAKFWRENDFPVETY